MDTLLCRLVYGYELLWIFRPIDRSEWGEAMDLNNDNIVDVSGSIDQHVNMLMVTQETDGYRSVMFLQFDDEGREYLVRLHLHFNLSASVNWAEVDENSDVGSESDTAESTVWTENSDEPTLADDELAG